MMNFSLSGGVEVVGFISPTTPLDTYPVIDPLYGIDGLRNVDTLTDLNNIPNLRRRAGMFVGINNGLQYYRLNPQPWNGTITDWTLVNFGNVDIYTTGATYSNATKLATFTRNDNNTYTLDLSSIDVNDTFVTGTTFTSNEATLTRNDGFDVFSLSGTNDVTLTNPSTNQIVIDVNGLKYFISETSPTGFTLSNGYRWFNTSIGSEFVYIDDGDSSQWVQPLIQPGPQGPVGPQGPSGFTGTFITTGITTSAATLTTNYTYYGVNYIGDVDLTLPDPTGIDGVNIMIKDEGGNASFNRIRLITSVGLIDGNSSIDMVNNYQSTYIVARNNNWWII